MDKKSRLKEELRLLEVETNSSKIMVVNNGIKPYESNKVCDHGKNVDLDKIIDEIERIADQEEKHDKKWALGLRYAIKIICRYK